MKGKARSSSTTETGHSPGPLIGTSSSTRPDPAPPLAITTTMATSTGSSRRTTTSTPRTATDWATGFTAIPGQANSRTTPTPPTWPTAAGAGEPAPRTSTTTATSTSSRRTAGERNWARTFATTRCASSIHMAMARSRNGRRISASTIPGKAGASHASTPSGTVTSISSLPMPARTTSSTTETIPTTTTTT